MSKRFMGLAVKPVPPGSKVIWACIRQADCRRPLPNPVKGFCSRCPAPIYWSKLAPEGSEKVCIQCAEKLFASGRFKEAFVTPEAVKEVKGAGGLGDE